MIKKSNSMIAFLSLPRIKFSSSIAISCSDSSSISITTVARGPVVVPAAGDCSYSRQPDQFGDRLETIPKEILVAIVAMVVQSTLWSWSSSTSCCREP